MNYVAAALIIMLYDGCPAIKPRDACTTKSAAKLPQSPLTHSTLALPTVEDVYWIMAALTKYYACDQLWRPGVPGLRLLAFQLSHLVKQHIPTLHAHFGRIGLHTEVLAAQWLLPLLSMTLPFSSMSRVWDLFFAEGWRHLFRVSLAVLTALQPRLLEMDLSDVTNHFRRWKELCVEHHTAATATATAAATSASDTDDTGASQAPARRKSHRVHDDDDGFWVIEDQALLLQLAAQVPVSTAQLMQLEREYALSVIRARLDITKNASTEGSVIDITRTLHQKYLTPVCLPALRLPAAREFYSFPLLPPSATAEHVGPWAPADAPAPTASHTATSPTPSADAAAPAAPLHERLTVSWLRQTSRTRLPVTARLSLFPRRCVPSLKL